MVCRPQNRALQASIAGAGRRSVTGVVIDLVNTVPIDTVDS
jgi:hypothetical protein